MRNRLSTRCDSIGSECGPDPCVAFRSEGLDQLPGTYPFTLDRSVKAYRLNSFLHSLLISERRKRFLAEPEGLFEEAQLTEPERAMIRARDWRALIRYGAMRGQSLDDFLETRNTKVLYSVAAQPQ